MPMKPPRHILLEREQKRLDKLADEQGYTSSAEMIHDLYEVKQWSLHKLADWLVTPMWTLRKRMDILGIKLRSRGGRHDENLVIEVTQELYMEICRDGLSAVADRLGVDAQGLERRLLKWLEQQKREEAL